jgi:hypothetical protein
LTVYFLGINHEKDSFTFINIAITKPAKAKTNIYKTIVLIPNFAAVALAGSATEFVKKSISYYADI